MKFTFASILVLFAFPLLVGCSAENPMAAKEQAWLERLATYENQIAAKQAEVEGVDDLIELFGQGMGTVSGNGTFVGDGSGTATLAGVGVVTGTVSGTVMIKGTQDIDITGFELRGVQNGYATYDGSGHFTATSDVAQHIDVIVVGDCFVIGAGTGMVFWSGDGYVFWYS